MSWSHETRYARYDPVGHRRGEHINIPIIPFIYDGKVSFRRCFTSDGRGSVSNSAGSRTHRSDAGRHRNSRYRHSTSLRRPNVAERQRPSPSCIHRRWRSMVANKAGRAMWCGRQLGTPTVLWWSHGNASLNAESNGSPAWSVRGASFQVGHSSSGGSGRRGSAIPSSSNDFDEGPAPARPPRSLWPRHVNGRTRAMSALSDTRSDIRSTRSVDGERCLCGRRTERRYRGYRTRLAVCPSRRGAGPRRSRSSIRSSPSPRRPAPPAPPRKEALWRYPDPPGGGPSRAPPLPPSPRAVASAPAAAAAKDAREPEGAGGVGASSGSFLSPLPPRAVRARPSDTSPPPPSFGTREAVAKEEREEAASQGHTSRPRAPLRASPSLPCPPLLAPPAPPDLSNPREHAK